MGSVGEWEKLAQRCEKARGPDRGLDALIFILADDRPEWARNDDRKLIAAPVKWSDQLEISLGKHGPRLEAPYYTGSLDVIVSLIEQELPGKRWKSGKSEGWNSEQADEPYAACANSKIIIAATPALALCAAFCRAMAAKCEDGK
jgi:hypothetical protein